MTRVTVSTGGVSMVIYLCEAGAGMRRDWEEAILAGHGEQIEKAMRLYFFHRHGIRSRRGEIGFTGCGLCRVLGGKNGSKMP